MTLHIKAGGLWKEAAPFVKAAGVWKQANAYVRQGGVWYQATSSGLKIVIDSATTLYNFNLKTWLQGAGLWPASGAVVIEELRITARTVITHSVLGVRVPDIASDVSGAPTAYNGFNLVKVESTNVPLPSGLVYRHNLWAYDQDLSVHAFTTGSGWPAGSLIRSFILEGRIIGRGGDGQGLTGAKFNTTFRFSGGTSDGSASLDQTVSMRHGWPALETTIPIQILNVSGELGGGGAGGNYPGVAYAYGYAQGTGHLTPASAQARAAALRAVPLPLTSHLYAFQRPEYTLYTATLGATGRPSSGTTLDTTNLFGSALMGGSARFVVNGCGGGQGGGLGGVSRKIASTNSNGTTYTYVNGVDGGNSTLNSPGGAATASVSYNTNDAKYGGTPGRVDGGGIPGSALGQDATQKLNVVHVGFSGSPVIGIFDITEAADFSLDNTYYYYVSQPLYARGGNAITGKSRITTVTGNIKGRQVG